jgi:sugar phosphate permease
MAVVSASPTTRLASALARWGIHYGWVVVGVIFLSSLGSAALRSMSGVLIHPFEAEFGWDRASITLAAGISLLMFGLAGPFVGRIMDRSSPRTVALTSVSLMALGALATTTVTAVWQLDLYWGVIIGAGGAGMGAVLSATVANRWFIKRRGLASGLLGTAMSVGQIIFVPLIMWLSVTVGWRVGVLLAVGWLLLVVFPLLFFLFRDDPKQVGLRPYGEATDAATRAAQDASLAQSTPMRVVLRSPDFWWLAAGFFVCGYTTNGLIGVHFIPHATEHGVGDVAAASIFGLMGGVNILGTIASGMLADRMQSRRVLLAGYYAFRGLSLLLLPFIDGPASLIVFALFYGLNWFATAPVSQIIAADTFGRRSVGEVFGWIFMSHQAGAFAAAYLGGLTHVVFGDYQIAFLSAGLAGLAAAGFSLQLREKPPQPAVQPAAA